MDDNNSKNAANNSTYDIFWKDSAGNPIWLETVSGLDSAKKRLLSLRTTTPGEYMIFDPSAGGFLEWNCRKKSA